jgi:hypothetical protein
MLIPSLLLKKLYTLGSLKNTDGGVAFSIKNRLSDAELVGLRTLAIDGQEIPLGLVRLCLSDGRCVQGNSSTSPAWRRSRSASPGRSLVNGEHARASSSSRWPPPRARWSPRTTAA